MVRYQGTNCTEKTLDELGDKSWPSLLFACLLARQAPSPLMRGGWSLFSFFKTLNMITILLEGYRAETFDSAIFGRVPSYGDLITYIAQEKDSVEGPKEVTVVVQRVRHIVSRYSLTTQISVIPKN